MKSTFIHVIAVAAVCTVAVTGCGKSKRQLAQEAEARAAAEQQRIAAEKQHEAALKVAELTESYRAKVLAVLKDPGSAQFDGLHLSEQQNAVCGRVNAKNSYGGYVGARPFISDDDGAFIWSGVCEADGTTGEAGAACLHFLIDMKTKFPQGCA